MRIQITEGRPKRAPEGVLERPRLEPGRTYGLSADETRLPADEIAAESIGDEVRIVSTIFDRLRKVPGSEAASNPGLEPRHTTLTPG